MFFFNIIANTKFKILAIIFFIITTLLVSSIVAIITSKVRIEVKDFDFFTARKKKIKEEYKLKISIFIFDILKIVNINLTKIDINKIKNKKTVKKISEKMKEKGTKENLKNFKNFLKNIPKIKIKMENLNLKLEIGTEDAAITSFIIAGVSAILGIVLKDNINIPNKLAHSNKNKYEAELKYSNKFEILPIYTNQNILNAKLDGKFTIDIGKFIRNIIKEKIASKVKNIKNKARKLIKPTQLEKLQKRTYKIKYRFQKIGNTN